MFQKIGTRFIICIRAYICTGARFGLMVIPLYHEWSIGYTIVPEWPNGYTISPEWTISNTISPEWHNSYTFLPH